MSFKTMRGKAQRGDLFILHLISEGKALIDSSDFFEIIKKDFSYKNGYHEEKADAAAIALFLLGHKSKFDRQDIRKRLVWAWRTIIIADSAEKRNPVFGSADLERYSGISGLKTAIDKRTTISDVKLIEYTKFLLELYADKKLSQEWPTGKLGQIDILRRRSSICSSTVDLLYPPIPSEKGVDPVVYE